MKTKSSRSRAFSFTITTAFLWATLLAPAQEAPQLVNNAPASGTFFLLSVSPPLPFPFDPYFGVLPVYSYDGVFFVDDSQVGDLQFQHFLMQFPVHLVEEIFGAAINDDGK